MMTDTKMNATEPAKINNNTINSMQGYLVCRQTDNGRSRLTTKTVVYDECRLAASL
jgi:hypothetical protein